MDQARAEVEAFSHTADAVGLPHHRWYVPLWRATLAAMEGRFDDAAALNAQALALGIEAQDPNAPLFHRIQRSTTALLARRFDRIDVDRPLEDIRDWPGRRQTWSPFITIVLAEQGRLDEARRLFAGIAADDYAGLPAGVNWHVVLDAAEACALVGSAAQARRLYERVRPIAHLFPCTARAVCCQGSAEVFAGRLALAAGESGLAVAHLERGVAENERIGARPYAAFGRWLLADALEARAGAGDAERAGALRERAEAERLAMGMGPLGPPAG